MSTITRWKIYKLSLLTSVNLLVVSTFSLSLVVSLWGYSPPMAALLACMICAAAGIFASSMSILTHRGLLGDFNRQYANVAQVCKTLHPRVSDRTPGIRHAMLCVAAVTSIWSWTLLGVGLLTISSYIFPACPWPLLQSIHISLPRVLVLFLLALNTYCKCISCLGH